MISVLLIQQNCLKYGSISHAAYGPYDMGPLMFDGLLIGISRYIHVLSFPVYFVLQRQNPPANLKCFSDNSQLRHFLFLKCQSYSKYK